MEAATLQGRMGNPAFVVPDAMAPLQALGKAVHRAGVPARTLEHQHRPPKHRPLPQPAVRIVRPTRRKTPPAQGRSGR